MYNVLLTVKQSSHITNFFITSVTTRLFINSGSHLLSRTVSSKVPSAAYVLTIVFGMRTGVSHKRIATRNHLLSIQDRIARYCRSMLFASLNHRESISL